MFNFYAAMIKLCPLKIYICFFVKYVSKVMFAANQMQAIIYFEEIYNQFKYV